MEIDKKDLQRMQREAVTIISELKSFNQTVRNKIDELITSGMGSSEMDELRAVLTEAEEVQKALEDVDGLKNSLKTEAERGNLESKIEEIVQKLRDLNRRVDEFEEKFLKYNVPRFHESESLENYAKSLREFMGIWKEEAKKGREKGEKSLIEWMQKLDLSDDEKSKTTFKLMRRAAIVVGTQISLHLSEAFLFMSVSANREEIKQNLDELTEILECLSVEGSSIVTDRFLVVVDFAERAMRLRELQRTGMEHVGRLFKRKDIFHLIIKEVLRFEVALCCPDLPMMLTNEVFFAMGMHLLKVFKKKLYRIGTSMDAMKKEVSLYFREEEVTKLNFLIETMNLGIKQIWNKLELKPE